MNETSCGSPTSRSNLKPMTMNEPTNRVRLRDKIKEFLLFSSGAERSILNRTPTEVNRYMGIGAAVFFTGLLAFLSATYALNMVFGNLFLAILLGFIWGLMIYNLDRFIVLSMRHSGVWYKDMFNLIPRLALALVFAVVISTPLELKIFEKEVAAEMLVMEQEQIMTTEETLKARFTAKETSLKEELAAVNTELAGLKTHRDQLLAEAVAEADGTGGSQRRNMGPIYRAKKAEADLAASEYESALAAYSPRITQLNGALDSHASEVTAALAALPHQKVGGIIHRLEALERLGMKSAMIYTAHLFIFLLFIIIEMAPILVKSLSLRSPYALVLNSHEHAYKMASKVKISRMEAEAMEKINVGAAVIGYRTEAQIRQAKEKFENGFRTGNTDLSFDVDSA